MGMRLGLLAAPLLMAFTSAPAPECGQDVRARDQLPAAQDLTGRPLPRQGLNALTFNGMPGLDSACARPPFPAGPAENTLSDPTSDVTHGLPVPGLAHPGLGRPGE